jgi:hypothetical protein
MLTLLVALVAIGIASGGEEEKASSPTSRLPPVERVARGVERVRQLRFRGRVPVRSIGSDEARREGRAVVARRYPPRRRLADEEVLKLLGLLGPRDDLGDIVGEIFGSEVAGYYDDDRGRLTLVGDAAGGSRELAEIVLAHELTHALEDQRFGLSTSAGGGDDRATAADALQEGTATITMIDYGRRHLDLRGSRADFLDSVALGDLLPEQRLPPYVQESLTFPYVEGGRFVDTLYRLAGGWKLVDYALRHRRPASTEQVVHVRKYLLDERPRPVRLRVAPLLGAGWRRVRSGVLGEFDTYELLRRISARAARRAANGWGGNRFELWRDRRTAGTCRAPCRARDALVTAWTWDTPRDAVEFRRALRSYVAREQRGHGAAIAGAGRMVVLALAPSARLARGLARRAA